MTKKVDVEVLGDAAYPEWNRLVANAPAGSTYSLPEYLDALCTVAGGDFRIVGVRRGGNLVGGVGLYVRTTSYGTYVGPRLLLYYNGIVLQRYEGTYPSKQTAHEAEALTALGEHLSAGPYASVNLRCRSAFRDARPFLDLGWSALPSYSYVVSVTDMKSSWSKVEQNLRRLVNRCDAQGFEVSSDDDFDGFLRLHRQTLALKGAGQYLPAEAFRRYFDILKRQDLCELFHVRLGDGRVIASQLVLLGPHPVTHTVSAATDPEFAKTGVSAFLRWRALEALSERDYAGNDLTDATLNPVTHFKSQLGGNLDLNFVLDSPRTVAFRAGTAAVDCGWRVRGVLGSLARRALRGSRL